MTILPKPQAERGGDEPGVGPRPRASPTPPAPASCSSSASSSSSSSSSSSTSPSPSPCPTPGSGGGGGASCSASGEDGACQASASISASAGGLAGGGGGGGEPGPSSGAGPCPSPGCSPASSSSSAASSSSSAASSSSSSVEESGPPGAGGVGGSGMCAQAQAQASHWRLLQEEEEAPPYPRPRRHHRHHHRRHHKRRHRASSPHRRGPPQQHRGGGPPAPVPPLALHHHHHLLHYRRPQGSPSPPGAAGGVGVGPAGGGGGAGGPGGGLLHHLLQQHRRRLLQQQLHQRQQQHRRRRLSPRGEEDDDEEEEEDDDEEGAGPGYNSEDEYEREAREKQQQQHQDPAKLEQEHWFEKALSEKKGFVIKRMKEDGACLFRAVADQVYGDQDMHDVVRKHCMDYLVKNADYFSNYVTEDFATYVSRKRLSSCHGNHIEMQAMAEMYNRPVEVYQYSRAGEENLEPINTFHGIHQTEDEPIRVSYHRNIHYNSVVNPNKATIGVGLGLPAYKPGSADQSLMKNAIKTSEESWIEQQMLEDKKRATDWEATNEAIEEQVARESYLQWLRDQEKQARQPRKASATCSSATAAASSGLEDWTGRSPLQRSLASSPEHSDLHTDLVGKPPSPGSALALGLVKPPSPCAPGTSAQMSVMGDRTLSSAISFCPALDCRAIMQQMSPTAFGLADWEDDEILASVLAVSQQEYLDSMKKGRESYREYSPDRS